MFKEQLDAQYHNQIKFTSKPQPGHLGYIRVTRNRRTNKTSFVGVLIVNNQEAQFTHTMAKQRMSQEMYSKLSFTN